MARSVVVFAERPNSGKTVVAAGLAQRLQGAGHEPLLVRVGEGSDQAAVGDATFFGRLPYGVGASPLGLTQAASMLGDLGKAVLVAEISPSVSPQAAAEKLDAIALSAGSPAAATRSELGTRFKGWISFNGEPGDALLAVNKDSLFTAPSVRDALAALPAGSMAERAAAAGIPRAITQESTPATVERLEGTFKVRPLRHPREVGRAAKLLAAIDLDQLLA
jgi:hypothetical protein